MQASSTPVRCLLLAVIFSLRADGCERGSMDNWNFDNLRQLLKENKTSEFRDEAQWRRGLKAPSLQDLTDMFNDIARGIVPQYIEEQNYTNIFNSTGNFSYSSGNIGDDNTTLYGKFNSDGETTAYSLFDFLSVKGTAGPYPYEAGTAFFTQVLYTKGDTFVNFQASVLGAILFKLPNGKYFANGNYTGLSQGNAMTFEEKLGTDVKSLGIFHSPYYHSLTEVTFNGRADETSFLDVANIVSMTGGTNGTMNIYGTKPTDNCVIIVSGNGTLMNENKAATLETYSVMDSCSKTHNSGFLSNDYLPYIFSIPRLGADVYLI
ncbi:uncharacterized protein [Palaemon carinicauda]|uniref:uncharacterized protein n=1 Tax=Palaemon carinicauda TaxID=392227 RepID=UPI0035B5C03E